MTPREPDFEAKAREIIAMWDAGASSLSDLITTALRREREEAQSRTAMLAAGMVRGLTSPGRGEISELAQQIQDLAAAPAAEPSEPVAPAPPKMDEDGCCVVCGRGLEPCYACEPAPSAAEKRIAELESALRWALGEEDHFPPRELEQGQYWWRIELRRRAKLAALASPAAQGKETRK